MLPPPPLLAALALLGGLLALEGTSLGQLMTSRPLVAATLGGWAAGAPEQGIVAGLLLEALHLAVLPVGAARYPEPAPAAVAAGALVAMGDPSYAVLLVAVLFALLWEWLCGLTVLRLRQWSVRFAVEPGTVEMAAGEIERRQWTAVVADFARGTLLTLVALLVLGSLLGALRLEMEMFPEEWARLALGFGSAAALASGLRLFGRRRLPLFLAGAVFAALWVWAR